MIRKGNLYSRPKKPFESQRMAEENKLLAKYGLKNKTEVWKSLAIVKYYRSRAKALANSSQEEQAVLFSKLHSKGIEVSSVTEVLALKIEDVLNRRITTVMVSLGLAKTPKQARQMIAHKRVLLNNRITSVPSLAVSKEDEKEIKLKEVKVKEVKAQEATA